MQEAFHSSSFASIAGGKSANSSLRTVKVEGRLYYLGLFLPGSKPQPASSWSRREVGVDAGASGHAYWWEHVPPLHVLKGRGGALGSGVCQGAGGEVRSVAETFDALRPTAGSEVPGLWAAFTGPCGAGGRQTRRAGIFLRCDPFALPGGPGGIFDAAAAVAAGGAWEVPGLTFVEGQRPTSRHGCEDIALEWRTSSACPLCRPEDFAPVTAGECKAWKQKIAFVRKRPCHGGAEQPKARLEHCGKTAAVTVAIVVPVAASLCCLLSYVLMLRCRYAKYMQLGEERGDAVPPAHIGASSAA